MRLRACLALLLFLSACAAPAPSRREPARQNPRLANLQRAATLPWRDGGRCVVREASQPWPVLVERCFQALDQKRVQFHDRTGRCAVASAGAAAVGLGACVLAAPEIVIGAVVVIGVVVVAVAIQEALEAYEAETRPVPQTKPAPQEPHAGRRPEPEPRGPDFPPVGPIETSGGEDRRRCKPQPVNHRGGHDLHDLCADRVPNNSFPEWDVFVNGKNFDALQLATRTLWEIKTDNYDTYSKFLKGQVIKDEVAAMRIELALARACGFDFRVGVRSAAHQKALGAFARELEDLIVVMDWC